jgi:hypothetical protein
VITTWSLAYLAGWVVATVFVLVAGSRLTDHRAPAAHPVPLSIVAGAVWPMLIIGALEFAAVALYTKARDVRAAAAEVPEFWMTRVAVASSVVPLR